VEDIGRHLAPIPLAGGENLRGTGFDLWHEAGVLRVCAGSDLSTDHLATSLNNRIATAVSKWTQTQLLDDEQCALASERCADFTPAPMSCDSTRCDAIAVDDHSTLPWSGATCAARLW
jgi:hypothetical protein